MSYRYYGGIGAELTAGRVLFGIMMFPFAVLVSLFAFYVTLQGIFGMWLLLVGLL